MEQNVDESLVPNFRVAIQSKDGFPLVYRSSRLDALSREKVSRLRSHYGIKTILDLRSSRELDLSARCALNAFFLPRCLDPKKDPKVQMSPVECANLEGEAFIDRGQRFILSLISPRSFFRLICGLPNLFWKAVAVVLAVTDYIFKTNLVQRHIMSGLLNSMGLEKFNLFMLDNCSLEVGTALHVFTERSRFPVLVNCSQGKDRTGLIVALLQLLSGYDVPSVVEHYALSYDLLKESSVLAEVKELYFLNDEWTWSQPDTMQHIIDYLQFHYHSLEHYLQHHCGLSPEDQAGIRANLTSQLTQQECHANRLLSLAISSEEDAAAPNISKVQLQVINPTSSYISTENENETKINVDCVEEISNERSQLEAVNNGGDQTSVKEVAVSDLEESKLFIATANSKNSRAGDFKLQQVEVHLNNVEINVDPFLVSTDA